MEQIKQLIWSFIGGMTDQDKINNLASVIQWCQRRIDIIQLKHSAEFVEVITEEESNVEESTGNEPTVSE